MRSKSLALAATILTGSALWLAGAANAQETLTLQTIRSNGTNLTYSTAQTIDTSTATNQPLFNAALSAFNALNSDTVRQNSSSFTGGQLVSPLFFPYGSSSVSVNSNVAALGNLTAAGTSASTNFFAFNEPDGAAISAYATATSPADLGTQLSLYDNGGNLVAIADGNASDGRSSLIDFTVPPGGAGTWQAEVTQGFSYVSPFEYKLLLALPLSALSQFTTNVVGSGALKDGSLGAYEVNANVGDQLSFDVHSTSPASTATELSLFDPNGNLVAIASGNGSDGLSSLIDFAVPSGYAGEWKIEVTPSAVLPAPTPYAYDLAIQGATALGPINPTPVPQLPTWAMALGGFAGIGLLARRRAGREAPRARSAPVRG